MAPATEEGAESLSVSGSWPNAVKSRVGTLVAGTYRLLRPIGAGGSSHVFEAEHVRLGKLFAVKLLRPDLDPSRQTAQRFRREARAIARLSSEYIVSVVDCGELDDGTPYLVMDLLQGEDLRSLLKREGSLPARRAVPIAIDVCRALAEAHAAGLVHRDLKPENLFITRRATGEDWCKVLDFGVAKMDASMSTTEGAIIGTVRYMAPEQLADGARVTTASDIYALGAILYECLSGHPAHAGETIQETMFSVLNTGPQSLESIPEALGKIVLGCLSKDPAQRPQGAEALERLLEASVGLRTKTTTHHTVSEDDAPRIMPLRYATRAWSMRAAIGLGVLLSLGAASWSWSSGSSAHLARAAPPIQAAIEQPSLPAPPAVAAPSAVTAPPGERAVLPSATSSIVFPASIPSAAKLRAKPPHGNLLPVKAPDAAASPVHVAGRTAAVGNLDPANPYSE